MRLTLLFLLLSLLAAYSIDKMNRPVPSAGKAAWSDRVFVRSEGRNCPLYYPADDLR